VHAAVQFKAWASLPVENRVREAEHYMIEQEKIAKEMQRIERHLVTARASGGEAISLPPSTEPPHPVVQAESARKKEEERLESVWLGGRAQVQAELFKLQKALHMVDPQPQLPIDIAAAVASAQAREPEPPRRGERVFAECSRIDAFLQKAF
jgi:hypothetical protein